jgi:hypothetical protein
MKTLNRLTIRFQRLKGLVDSNAPFRSGKVGICRPQQNPLPLHQRPVIAGATERVNSLA